MSARVAAYVATGLSVMSLIFCLLYIPILINKIANIHDELQMDMDEFKILEAEAWSQIIGERKDRPSVRKARQFEYAPAQCRKNSHYYYSRASVIGPPKGPGKLSQLGRWPK